MGNFTAPWVIEIADRPTETVGILVFYFMIFFGWLVITKRKYCLNTSRHFYREVSVFIRDLLQKKLVQFFRFLLSIEM